MIASRAPAQPIDELRRNCVICTCDPREIICWPCRCLSMCDGCREVLASKSSASKHSMYVSKTIHPATLIEGRPIQQVFY
ncbi:RING-type domain-containing protein [Mycena venus]|uniref:RING-type domain-containing protein n=1 Tax=Mycena venus TaxID=2733690 RepID=A0A8H7D7R8_9AGAR|nr:RING-type domain-containing protein [Mycena venus]